MRIENFIYYENYQKFTREIFKNGSFINEETKSFKKKEIKEKIIFSNNVIIVILNDGTKGISKCHPNDEYNETKGIKIAYNRAKIKSLKKELKKMIS